jgi:hypothetical protein
MKPFSKNELTAAIIIFSVVFLVTGLNMNISLRRSRDFQRKADLGVISEALEKFYDDYGFFPPSENGKIKICANEKIDDIRRQIADIGHFDSSLFYEGLRGCQWGVDPFKDVVNNSSDIYLSTFPSDPRTEKGFSYYYLSNTKRYQIYTYLEGEKDEGGYDTGIVSRNLNCGIKTCSFGKSYAETPLNKSIEEYEAELQNQSSGK